MGPREWHARSDIDAYHCLQETVMNFHQIYTISVCLIMFLAKLNCH
jgi:hypothetical protein